MTAWFRNEPFSKVSRPGQWGALFFVSTLLVILLVWVHLPAALMLGPMIAGILLETGGGSLRVPAMLYWASQAVIGCLVARSISSEIASTFAAHWPLFLGTMFSVIGASCALGWVVSRFGILPDAIAVWGLLPGAASVMMLMADDRGADGRLVAFMQYLRVVLVALAAAVIARLFYHTGQHGNAVNWLSPIHWGVFSETLAFICLSIFLGRKSGIPAGVLLVPLALGTLLHIAGILTFELPPWFLALSYALLGWNTGLRFTRKILVHAARSLPQIILSVLLLMAFCGGIAFVLVKTAGIDPLTAYLATTPGGLDSAAIIAASTKVNMSFVMAMQTSRLLMVLMIGPALARMVARAVIQKDAY